MHFLAWMSHIISNLTCASTLFANVIDSTDIRSTALGARPSSRFNNEYMARRWNLSLKRWAQKKLTRLQTWKNLAKWRVRYTQHVHVFMIRKIFTNSLTFYVNMLGGHRAVQPNWSVLILHVSHFKMNVSFFTENQCQTMRIEIWIYLEFFSLKNSLAHKTIHDYEYYMNKHF